MKFVNFAVVKLALSVAFGITVAHFYSISAYVSIRIPAIIFLLLVLIWFAERKQLRKRIFFGMLTYAFFFSFGYLNYQWSESVLNKNHYSLITTEAKPELIQLKIIAILKPNAWNTKYLAEVKRVSQISSEGTVLLQLKRDSIQPELLVDDVLWVMAQLQETRAPLNPHQFNYKEYLKQQGVTHQISLEASSILRQYMGQRTLKGFANEIREHIIQHLEKSPIEQQQRAVIQALLLGERNDIDSKLYAQYAAAGALHILAVSGLHVGILYLIFGWLLSPLAFTKLGRTLQPMIIVILLWCFATIAGLSPSVVRAVTMFSFFALARMLQRPTHSYNTLFLSFLVLLLLYPQWLFHVGFQLSYLAVFFILWVQPKLYALYRPKFYVDRMLWGIITVTLAAQLGIAPLSMYYFHQFPGLFFVTNIVVLPFLAILLSLGIVVLLLSVCHALPDEIALLYNGIIKQLNEFMGWVAAQEHYFFDDLPFTLPLLLTSYLLIILTIRWGILKKRGYFVYWLGSMTLLYGALVLERSNHQHEELILFHTPRKTQLGYLNNRKFTLFTSDTIAAFDGYAIKAYRVGNWVETYTSEEIPSLFKFKNKLIFRMDSIPIYPKLRSNGQSISADVVLLTFNTKVHLDRLIDSLQPKCIVADGSNYLSYVRRWEKTCATRNINFHYTGKHGAYVFK